MQESGRIGTRVISPTSYERLLAVRNTNVGKQSHGWWFDTLTWDAACCALQVQRSAGFADSSGRFKHRTLHLEPLMPTRHQATLSHPPPAGGFLKTDLEQGRRYRLRHLYQCLLIYPDHQWQSLKLGTVFTTRQRRSACNLHASQPGFPGNNAHCLSSFYVLEPAC